MSIIVHGRATSSNVQTVMWALAELGLDHERRDVGGAFGGNDQADYLAMNPNGLVPVLQDGDVTLFESATIVRYLAVRYGDGAFYPTDPGKRGPLDMWAEWGKHTFARTVIYDIFWTLVRTPKVDRDMAKLEASIAHVSKLVGMVEARLGDDDWLGGDTFTFADVILAHSLYRHYTLPFERAASPILDAYYQRCQKREAFRTHVMVDYSSLQVE